MSKITRSILVVCALVLGFMPFHSCQQSNTYEEELNELHAQFDSIMSQYLELKSQSQNLPTTGTTASQDSLIQAQAAEINSLIAQLEEAQKKNSKGAAASTSDSQLQKELKQKEESIKQLQKKLAQQEKDLKALQSKTNNGTTSTVKTDAETARLQKQIKQQESQIASLKSQIASLSSSNSAAAELNKKLDELQRSNNNLTSKNKALGATNTDLNGQVKKLQDEISGLNKQIATLNGQVKDLKTAPLPTRRLPPNTRLR